jgi:hypothetical protein
LVRCGTGDAGSRLPTDTPGAALPSPSCATFLKASTKASLQWSLEAGFQQFERSAAARGH